MSVPVKLQSLPKAVLEEVFTSANIRGRSLGNSLTPLSFPKSRCALWDGSPVGETLRLQFCSHRNPRLVLSEKALFLALRHARHLKKPRLLCFLLGSLSINTDEESVTLTLDRFDPGRDQPGASGRVPSAPLPGDVLVPCLFSTEPTAEREALQSESDLHHCLKALQQTLSGRQTLDLCQLIKVKGHVWCSQRLDATEFSLDWLAVCPSATVHAHAVRPLPIIPTALLRSLNSAVRPLHAAGRHRGFLTMDQTRKLLLLLESDPKACSLPLVGLWLSGVTQVSHPQVWAWCLRFLFSSALQNRVFSESGSFLLLLFPSTHRSPQFFQFQPSSPQLDFQRLRSSQSVTLYQGALVDGGTLHCELSREGDVFRETLSSLSSVLGISDQDSGVEDEDLSPRPSPSPHLPAQQARRVQPSVPELSLLIDSSFPSNHGSTQPAGSAHTSPAGEKNVLPSLLSSGSRAPHLHSTPNSNLQPPCCCCCSALSPSSPHLTPPFSSPYTPPSFTPSPKTFPSPSPHHTPPSQPPPSSSVLPPPSTVPPPPSPVPPPPSSATPPVLSSWSMDYPSCPTPQSCDAPAAEMLPSDAYRLLLHQDQQLRLLQAQVQTLLETQKKLQTSTHCSRTTACVATATGASLLWTEHQEVQAPPSASHKPPPFSSSSSSSSRDISVVGGIGPSPPPSPPSLLLGESVSMCPPAEESQSFYQNLMTQLTSRLQEEGEEESGRRGQSQRSSPRNNPRAPSEYPVLNATVRRLPQLDVHKDQNALTESERSRRIAVENASTLASISPAAVLTRLSVSASSVAFPGSSSSGVDLGLEANAIALRYHSDATLSRLAGSAPSHDSQLSANNMSVATRKYIKRYGLIEEEDEDEGEVPRPPLTDALNTKLLPQSQLIRELRPKMALLAEDKENRQTPRRRRAEASVGNILDLSRLRQLPKLF